MMQKEYLFACEGCGAKLKFSTSEGDLKCEHCSHINHIQRDTLNIVEKEYEKAISMLKEQGEKKIEINSIKCQSCAAVFELKEDIHASTCPYCDSAIVNETEFYRPLQPQALLPFKIAQEEAVKKFKEWIEGRWFAPDRLKKMSTTTKLNALYIPHWTYDSDTHSSYRGRRGDKYYENENYTQTVDGKEEIKTRKVEKIRWHDVSGELSKDFNDLLVMASKSLKHTLSSWDLENLVDYDEAYLSGYESEVYTLELEEGLVFAKNSMQLQIRGAINTQIGGDEQEITLLETSYANITYKQILLPIYASAFKFDNKVYSYVINGRNGDISGDRPYSKVKIALVVVASLSVIAALIYFFS